MSGLKAESVYRDEIDCGEVEACRVQRKLDTCTLETLHGRILLYSLLNSVRASDLSSIYTAQRHGNAPLLS